MESSEVMISSSSTLNSDHNLNYNYSLNPNYDFDDDNQIIPGSENSGIGTLLNDGMTLLDAARGKTVKDLGREIVGGSNGEERECKTEMVTLEEFLSRAATEDEEEMGSVKAEFLGGEEMYGYGGVYPVVGAGEGKRKRGRGSGGVMMEPLDKVAQQRQKRMIKNRESAARSRERKQAYQVELEAMAAKLEEENEQLWREKADRTKERLRQLIEKVIPIQEKRKPPNTLRRVCSM